MVLYEKPDNLAPYRWRFTQYVSPALARPVEKWREGMPAGPFRADMDAFVSLLARSSEWTYPDVRPLKGKQSGLKELRWVSGKKQHRLIGRETSDHVFLFLIGCTHKQQVYDPVDALDTAVKRWAAIKSGEASSCEYTVLSGR